MRKITAMALTTALTLPMLLPVSAAAAAPNTPKEEVVYINLNGDGSAKEINVVNIFDLEKDGQITDYGKYQSVRNMTTTDKINYSGDTVTIHTKPGKLYYEGKLDGNEMPWNISIHYYMDGKEYDADKIAGMSGALKIAMRITENEAYSGNFFDDYALQASVTLDTGSCSNIVADGATTANVGSDKQLTYTILPGKGADIEITADVTNFEMDSIAINGIPLSLDVEIDDEDLMGQVTSLLDAIEKLDDGAGELQDGISSLQDGVQDDLKSGTKQVADGAGKLQSGAGELVKGGEALESGAGALQSGADTLDSGLRSLNDGIAQVQAGLDALNGQSDDLTGGSAQIKNVLSELQSALNGINATAEEIQALVSTSAQIKQGISQLAAGTASLENSVNYQAYEAAMSEKGIDISSLQSENAEAISSINKLIGQVNSMEAALSKAGISLDAVSPWESKCISMGNDLIALLKKNNASLSGTKSYFNSVSENTAGLAESAESLKENYTQFDGAIRDLADTLTDLLFKMSQLKDAVNTLVEEYGKLDAGLNAYTDGVAKVTAGYQKAAEGAGALVEGSGSLKDGSASLYAGTTDLLNGMVELYNSTGTLKDGAGQLDDGAAELLAGVAQLYSGAGEMKDGTSTLRDETSGMDTEIEEKVDSLLENVTGEDIEITSFVSDKNTNVDAVQFVIQSPAIETAEPEKDEIQQTEDSSFWSKFLRMFGIDS